jgi:hypothetical protein
MPDASYSTSNLILRSRGVIARFADDQPPAGEGYYLNMQALEEIEESGLATRLGSTLITKVGTAAQPIGGGPGVIHSLSRLPGLNNQSWRYAGKGTTLYRLAGDAPGLFTQISNSLSGKPWTSVQYNPVVSSYPILYIADANGVIKDTGTLAAPQNAGIKQPQYPVQAQAQEPDDVVLDPFRGTDTHVAVNVGSYTANYPVSATSLDNPILSLGLQEAVVGSGATILSLYQSLVIDTGGPNEETVLVLEVTATGFWAVFTKTHLAGALVEEFGLSGTIAPSTTGSITLPFVGKPISAWPVKLEQEDYIKLDIFISFPLTVQSITLKFDCGDGSFQSDYFWRTIGQGPLQSFLDANTDSSTAAADAALSQTLGLFSNAAGGVSGLNTGNDQWTSLLMQLSDFSSTGRAAFDDPVFNWQNVNGYQIEITTNSAGGTPTLFTIGSLQLVGGAGPDSFAGVAYDYLFTFFNIVDYTESNPSMVMTNIDPPLNTNWVLPRRQPVLLTMTHPVLDPQTTHLRIYRRGGTLGDNYRRIDQVPCVGATTLYTDILSDLDIQQADTVSFTNDVPVTSSLPVPVNTTLTAAVVTENAVATVTPADMTNISVGQQVDLGDVTASNFEVVIVLSITGATFNAFVQNTHAIGEPVAATAAYAQPVDIIQTAYDQGWYAGDKNNPSYLYYTPKGAIQYVSSAAFVPVSVPSDPITAIVNTRGNLFVSTFLRWWAIAPNSTASSSPIVYPTQNDHGCVGKNAWTLKDGVVYYVAVDGPRVFMGGESKLISEIVQFVWQGVGPTPIPIALPGNLFDARVSYWNQFVFFSYVYDLIINDHPFSITPVRARLILDVEQKRWRNDLVDAQSMFLEQDTNQLVFGDSQGLVHLDRQPIAFDEGNNAGTVSQVPIAIDLETPYSDQGQPSVQKQYQEFTLDANTNGNPVNCVLNFNDGEFTEDLGSITTTERQRFNLNLNNGEGFFAYKVALELTGSGTERIFLYQAKLKSLALAMTRKSWDSYWLRMGIDSSKLLKQIYAEYNAGAPINCSVFYDGSSTAGFTFVLPQYNGVRNALRVRLPAVKFRIVRFIFTSDQDFQLWTESRYEWKDICQGKGWSIAPLMT